MDRTYAQKMTMGNPMGVATAYPSSQMYGPKMSGGYVAKSRLKGSSASSVRSKSMRSGMSRRSHLSKRKPTKRFNEELDSISRKSKASYHHQSRAVPKNYVAPEKPVSAAEKKKKIIEAIEKMDDNNLEKLRSTFNIDKEETLERNEIEEGNRGEEKKEEEAGDEPRNDELGGKQEDQELHDEIDSLYYGSYSESVRSDKSRRSVLTSATYISKLEKELKEEKKAREKLAEELETLKKISSEISSHLGLQQAIANNNQQ
jgi:hypothetical protein